MDVASPVVFDMKKISCGTLRDLLKDGLKEEVTFSAEINAYADTSRYDIFRYNGDVSLRPTEKMSGIEAKYELNCGNVHFWFSPSEFEKDIAEPYANAKWYSPRILMHLNIPPKTVLEIRYVKNIKY